MITEDLIHEAQKKWGDGIVKIGSLKNNVSECVKYTTSFLNEMYDFKNNNVLFKPTKASVEQFRPTFKMALSYFLGGDNSFCNEDQGFAMKPWVKVNFENSGFLIDENRAIAMGNYFFTDKKGNATKVEFTFGYKLVNSNLFIDLHHSSLPFSA
tara:strand:- start:142 stop:603 length:462 start_codon:yes stop_codon:yes gene_type:complete